MAEPEEPLHPETRLQLYMESLRARIDPARYAAFERPVAGTARALRETAAGRPQAVVDLPDEEEALAADLVGEMMTVISTLTGATTTCVWWTSATAQFHKSATPGSCP
jgi:hypothetical protein